jgi:hypothetical protein
VGGWGRERERAEERYGVMEGDDSGEIGEI